MSEDNGNDFLTKIIEKYIAVHDDFVESELLRSHAIRELIEISATNNQILLQKVMPIILSLFKENCIDPYETFSKDSKDLDDKQIFELHQILKTNIK